MGLDTSPIVKDARSLFLGVTFWGRSANEEARSTEPERRGEASPDSSHHTHVMTDEHSKERAEDQAERTTRARTCRTSCLAQCHPESGLCTSELGPLCDEFLVRRPIAQYASDVAWK